MWRFWGKLRSALQFGTKRSRARIPPPRRKKAVLIGTECRCVVFVSPIAGAAAMRLADTLFANRRSRQLQTSCHALHKKSSSSGSACASHWSGQPTGPRTNIVRCVRVGPSRPGFWTGRDSRAKRRSGTTPQLETQYSSVEYRIEKPP